MPKLVSIITPCFNGDKYLDMYFKSILAQSYPAIELLFINDGSTDKTEEMALKYGEQLKNKGYEFRYIYQENSGQSAAINQGLEHFKGDYLNWTDADNFLTEDSIERRVSILEDNPDLGLVIGRTVVVDDIDFKQVGLICETSIHRTSPRQLIEDFLKGQMSCTCCCSTMVRSSMFRDSMPVPPQIETPREIGQNYQLFIPIMFEHKTKYVQDILGYYVTHSDSHSNSSRTYEQRMRAQDVAYQTLNCVSERVNINDDEKIWFKRKILEYDCKNRLNLMQQYQKNKDCGIVVSKMKEAGMYDFVARKMVLKIKYPFMKELGDLIWKFRNK